MKTEVQNVPLDARASAQPAILPVDKDPIQDAEERLEHTQSLAQQWRIFDATLSSLVDFVYTFDREGRFLYANKPLLDLWGLTLEDALGKNFFDLQYPDELAAQLQGQIQQVFETGLRLSDETQYTSPAGTAGYYEYVFSPVIGISGSVELVAGATRDISVRKAAEKHTAEMEARFRGLLEAAPDAMVVVNQAEEIVLLNVQAEKRFRYTRDELIGQKVRNIIPDGFAPRMMTDALRSTEDAVSPQIVTGIELTGRRKDGSEFPVEIMLSPLDSSEGALVTAAIRDITERRIVEDVLQQRTADLRIEVAERRRAEEQMRLAKDAAEMANRVKGEFLANMSHEVRTPLNGVIGMTDLVLDTELTAEQRDRLETLKSSADSLLRLVNDILDFSKFEAGKVEMETIDFNLHDCAEEALKTFAARAEEQGLELLCDIAPEVPEFARGDPGRLRQIILNLVSNAIKFTHRGEVSLKMKIDNKDSDTMLVGFTVSDTGIGISAEKRLSIFSPFTQADSSTTRKYGGTGLGLTISARMVAMMGGTIRLESEVDQGSRFHFTARLTVSSGAEPQLVVPPIEIEQPALERGLRILLVEDNRINQIVAKGILERMGHSVVVAGNGNEALLMLGARSFDLVLMDIQMPEMDGLTATARIRAGEAITHTHMPIIAMTAHAMKGDRERCLAAGMDGYVTKPINAPVLEVAIAEAVREPEVVERVRMSYARRPDQPALDKGAPVS